MLASPPLPRFDIADLFAAIEADPARLIEHLIPIIESSHGRSSRTKREIRFGSRGSFSIRLPDGRWYDHESQIGGGSWKLAKHLGWQTEDIARVYGLEDGAPSPELKAHRHLQTEINREQQEDARNQLDAALTKAIKLSLAKIEDVAGGVRSYLDKRGINHLAVSPSIQEIPNPVVLSRDKGELYELRERCLASLVTNDQGGVEAIALTRLTDAGTKIEPSRKARYSLGPIGKGYVRAGNSNSETVVLVEGVEDAGTIIHPEAWPNVRVLASIGGIRINDDRELKAAAKIVIAVDRDVIAYKKNRKPDSKPSPRKLSRILRRIRRANPFADILVAKPDRGTRGETADLNDVLAQHGPDRVKTCLNAARLVIKGKRKPHAPTGWQSQIADVLSLAETRLQREMEKAIDSVAQWKLARDERDQLRQLAHDRIDGELVKVFGHAVINPGHPEYEAFKKERRRRRAAATRDATKTICSKLGLVRLPAYPDNYVIAASPGLGKTSQELQLIAKRDDLRFDWHAPSHNLIDQSRGDLERIAPEQAIGTARGRLARDPLERCKKHPHARPEWDAGAMCPRHEIVNKLAVAGINANQTLCTTCPLKDVCGYRQQRKELAEVRNDNGTIFAPAAYLQHSAFWRRGDICVIDEDIASQMFSRKFMKAAILNDPATTFRLFKSDDLERGFETLELLYQALVEHSGASVEYLLSRGIDHDRLKETKKALDRGQAKDPEISGRLADSELERRVRAITVTGRWEIIAIIRKVMRAMKAGATRLRSLRLIGDATDPTLEIETLAGFRPPKRQSVMVLDATASLPLLERMTGQTFKTIEVTAPENLDVTVVDTSGSKLALNGGAIKDEPTDNETAAAEAIRDGIIRGLESFAEGKICPVLTHKTTEYLWRDELPEYMPVAHFGNLVGLNDFERCDRAVILGRQQPHESQFLPMAAALAETQGRDIIAIADHLDLHPEHRAQLRRDGYLNKLMPDGSFDERLAWHPDPIIEAMRFRACEGELIQAIGRLRSIRSTTPKKLLIVTNVPIPGIVPNQVIPYRELKRGKVHATAIEEYIHRLSSKGSIVPLGASDMAKLEPELFSTPNAAKVALRKIKGVPPVNRFIEGWDTFNRATYRRSLQRGQPCRALVCSGISTPNAMRELERLLGESVASFDLNTETSKFGSSPSGCGRPLGPYCSDDGKRPSPKEINAMVIARPDQIPAVGAGFEHIPTTMRPGPKAHK